MGSIEIEYIAFDRPSSVVIPHVHSTDGLGSEDYNFSGVQTLKFLKAPNSRNDLYRHAEELWSRVSRRVNTYLSLRAVFLPSSGDNISSLEVQLKRRGSGDIGRAVFFCRHMIAGNVTKTEVVDWRGAVIGR